MDKTGAEDVGRGSRPKTRASGSSYRRVPGAGSVSMLGLGMVIGAAIGAGVALLMAPASGEDTRDRIRHGMRTIRGSDGAWDKLGRELRRANAVRRKRRIVQQQREDQKAVEKERAERDVQVTPV